VNTPDTRGRPLTAVVVTRMRLAFLPIA